MYNLTIFGLYNSLRSYLGLLLQFVSGQEGHVIRPLPAADGIHAPWKIVVCGGAIVDIVITQRHLVGPLDKASFGGGA